MKLLSIAAMAAVFAFAVPLPASEIHDAAAEGNVTLVAEILERDAGAAAERDDRNDTPLHHAARAGHTEAVRLLLDAGVAVDIGDNENSTALDVASSAGKLETVSLLVERGAQVEHRDDFGMTPLLFAALGGEIDVARFLVERGADAGVQRADGLTALHAAAWNGSEPLVRLLVDAGADVNARNRARYTPLLSASGGRGGLDVIRFLVDSGADVHDREGNGLTALTVAAWNGRADVVQYLIDEGVSVRARSDPDGQTALHVAAHRGRTDVIEVLLDNGLPIDIETDFGWTPLFMTSLEGQTEAAGLLLDRGADVNVAGNDGMTVLMRAIDSGSMELAELLLSRGADADAIESEAGRTLLHFAALSGDLDLAELMLEHGASVDPLDDFSMTPIRYAAKYGHRDIAEFLASRGAVTHALEENYERPALLDREVGRGEAALWYLGHCGWALKTENHFLIFDYWTRAGRPANPSLTNGYLAPSEIAGENVCVFVTHEHPDHYDPAIFEWAGAIDDITYVYGFSPETLPGNGETGYTGPAYRYLGPREHAEIEGVSVRTIDANDAGVGFLVSVDGLKIYHAGDHAGWADGEREGYFGEIDYLGEYADGLDIAFLNVTGCHAHDPDRLMEGNVYTLERLQPRVMIPTHAGFREARYVEAATRLAEAGVEVPVTCPDNRGDSFYYSGGKIE
jgi:ankyrin repeat protein/L-ascorbate metabolism protein UlaG (beta-lactamase superfamily)